MQGPQVVVLVGACLLLGGVLSARLHVASPLVLLLLGVLAGALLGAIPGSPAVELPPTVVLLLFLPALLYWESITTSLREIRADLRGIALLAVGLVLLTAVAVAAVGHAVGMSWPAAFTLGAVVSPTDATAVSAVAGRLPRRTLTTLRAESLINDGTALVIYALAVEAATGVRRVGLGEVAWRLPVSYAGGVLLGLSTAVVVLVVRRWLHEPRLENVLSVLIPFLAYLPAQKLGVSGVVAVVSCGLLLSQATPRVISARTRLQAEGFWQLTAYILNGALFVLVGLELRPVLGSSDVDGVRVGGVGLAALTGGEHPRPRGQLGRHIDDGLAVGDQALREVTTHALTPFDRPTPLRPFSSRGQQLSVAVPVGAEPAGCDNTLPFVEDFDRRRPLMRVHPNHHMSHCLLLPVLDNRCRRGGQRYFELGQTPLEPHLVTVTGGAHAMREPRQPAAGSR